MQFYKLNTRSGREAVYISKSKIILAEPRVDPQAGLNNPIFAIVDTATTL